MIYTMEDFKQNAIMISKAPHWKSGENVKLDFDCTKYEYRGHNIYIFPCQKGDCWKVCIGFETIAKRVKEENVIKCILNYLNKKEH